MLDHGTPYAIGIGSVHDRARFKGDGNTHASDDVSAAPALSGTPECLPNAEIDQFHGASLHGG